MTTAAFLEAKRKATAPGRMDIVTVVIPPDGDGLPMKDLFKVAVDHYKREDVTAVVLHKGAA